MGANKASVLPLDHWGSVCAGFLAGCTKTFILHGGLCFQPLCLLYVHTMTFLHAAAFTVMFAGLYNNRKLNKMEKKKVCAVV